MEFLLTSSVPDVHRDFMAGIGLNFATEIGGTNCRPYVWCEVLLVVPLNECGLPNATVPYKNNFERITHLFAKSAIDVNV